MKLPWCPASFRMSSGYLRRIGSYSSVPGGKDALECPEGDLSWASGCTLLRSCHRSSTGTSAG